MKYETALDRGIRLLLSLLQASQNGQLSAFTSRADKARARLAQLAKDEFGGVREMFGLGLPGAGDDPEPGRTFRAGLDLRGRKQMPLAWFKRALEREKLSADELATARRAAPALSRRARR